MYVCMYVCMYLRWGAPGAAKFVWGDWGERVIYRRMCMYIHMCIYYMLVCCIHH